MADLGGGGMGGMHPVADPDVFTKIETDFSVKRFLAQNQVVSKKKKKKKRSSPELRVIFRPDSLRLGWWGGMHPEMEPNYSK